MTNITKNVQPIEEHKNDIKYLKYSKKCILYEILFVMIYIFIETNYIKYKLNCLLLLKNILYPIKEIFIMLIFEYRTIYNNTYKKISYENCCSKLKFYRAMTIYLITFYYYILFTNYLFHSYIVFILKSSSNILSLSLSCILIMTIPIRFIGILICIIKYIHYKNIMDIMDTQKVN